MVSPATDLAVRAMLADLRRWLAARADGAPLHSVELGVAEALNNITEHAYAGQAPGPVHLLAVLRPGRLKVRLQDHGAPLPGRVAPSGERPPTDPARDTLPEGGFGWFLIRDLANGVDYRRAGGVNRLMLTFCWPPAGG